MVTKSLILYFFACGIDFSKGATDSYFKGASVYSRRSGILSCVALRMLGRLGDFHFSRKTKERLILAEGTESQSAK